MPDLYADVDAYNLFNLCNSMGSNSLKSVFKTYYLNGGLSTRFTDFTNGWDYKKILDTVKTVCKTSGQINIVWPLYKRDADGNETTTKISLTSTQINAIATSFADYIWQKVQAE